MRIINDIFFANVSGSPKDNHFLDLYLPDKCGHTEEGLYTVRKDTRDQDAVGELFRSHSDSDLEYRFGELQKDGDKMYCQKVPSSSITDVSAINDNVYTSDSKHERNVSRNAKTRETDPLRRQRISQEARRSGVPLVIFVHGGGWRRGGRQAWTHYLYFDVNFLVVLLSLFVGTYKNVGQALARHDIACAVISYPLTEAGLGCLLMELCLSYIQSCIAMFLVCAPVLVFQLDEVDAMLSSEHSLWIQFQTFAMLTSIINLCLIIMLLTNIATSLLLAVKRREFNLKGYQIRALWLCLVVGSVAIWANGEGKLLSYVLLSLITNQAIILKLRLSRCGGCYEDQTKVLAKAVRWAKTEGGGLESVDTSRVYLMGHSAGGHLVSLTVLDDDILETEGCSHKDIKGVVSLSGVYDLMCLGGPFLKPFYLLPTFGHCRKTWLRASPTHLMKTRTNKDDQTRPKFLLFVAENDLFLKQQSRRFSEILQEAEVDCRHVEILGTNHFTIVTNIVKRFTGNEKSVLTHISHFIHNMTSD